MAGLVVASACSASDEVLTSSNLIVLERATLIDGTSGIPLENSVVVIEGEYVVRVGKVGDFDYPSDAKVIELDGRYLLPGFVDLHVHPRVGAAHETLRMLLAFGVTTIRIPGVGFESHDSLGVELRTGVADGDLTGPRIFTGAKIVEGAPKSFPDDVEVSTVEELRAEVRRQAQLGVDLVKLYWNTPPSFIAGAVDEADAFGIQVVGHLRMSSWTEAAQLGIDGLVHSAGDGPTWELLPPEERDALRSSPFPEYYHRFLEAVDLDQPWFDSLVDMLIENEVTVDPTLVLQQSLYYGDDVSVLELLEPQLAPESVRATWGQGWEAANPVTLNNPQALTEGKGMFDIGQQIARRFHERGVRLAVGTDVGMPWITPGVSFHRELQLLVATGIPEKDVIVSATRNGARALGQEAHFGTIAANHYADIVVLTDDPIGRYPL